MSTTPERKRSLFSLIGDLPGLLMDLVREEIEHLKQEMLEKAKHAGVGVGLLAGAAAFLFFAVGSFITAAILGLSLVVPPWAAALIVGGIILVLAVILGLIGVNQVKKGDPTPTQTLDNIQKDVETITGTGTGLRAGS